MIINHQVDLSYTISPSIRNRLLEIETLRRDILILPLTPQDEIRLRWEAELNRLLIFGKSIPPTLAKPDIVDLLTYPSPRPFMGISSPKQAILYYKRGLDWIYFNWLANYRSLTPNTIEELAKIIGQSTKINFSAVKTMLDYLQSKPENPVIQAALAFSIASESKLPPPLPNMLSYLFLYKGYYDIRRLFILEPIFKMEPDTNLFLDYFTQSSLLQLSDIKSSLSEKKFSTDLSAKDFKLSDRQAEILSSFDAPGVKITNAKVQKMFGVSQITASRDLARLSSLGLLTSQGKGRSVYYTKT